MPRTCFVRPSNAVSPTHVTLVAALLGLLALVLLASSAEAALYRWIDANGEVHYSDKKPPGKGIKEHKLRAGSSYAPPVSAKAKQATGEGEDSDDEDGKPTVYESLVISAPKAGAVIRTPGRVASVSVGVSPGIDTKAGDKLEIMVDGKVISTGGATSATVSGLTPGGHSASARIRNKDGKTVKTAGSVSFRIRQPGT